MFLLVGFPLAVVDIHIIFKRFSMIYMFIYLGRYVASLTSDNVNWYFVVQVTKAGALQTFNVTAQRKRYLSCYRYCYCYCYLISDL